MLNVNFYANVSSSSENSLSALGLALGLYR